jgi:hypothetical protein
MKNAFLAAIASVLISFARRATKHSRVVSTSLKSSIFLVIIQLAILKRARICHC